MFFEMRVDLGTLDAGERLLPFGLLAFNLSHLACSDTMRLAIKCHKYYMSNYVGCFESFTFLHFALW